MRVTPIADYHQLYLAPAETYPVFDPARPDDLVQVAPDRRSLIIVTGIAMGPVTLDVDLLDAPDDDAGADGTEKSAGALIIDQPLYLLAPTIDTGVSAPVFSPHTPAPTPSASPPSTATATTTNSSRNPSRPTACKSGRFSTSTTGSRRRSRPFDSRDRRTTARAGGRLRLGTPQPEPQDLLAAI
jgi:hypothetical protein